MITVKGRELIIPRSEQQIGTPYDNNAEVRHIRIDRVTSGGIDIANLNYRLDLEYANHVLDTCLLDVEVQEEYILLTWTIPDTCLTQKGTVWIAVRGYDENGSIKWATNRGAVYVGHTIFDGPAYTGKLSELEQLEERITQKTEILDTNESERKEAEEQRKANEERRVNNEAEWQRQAEAAINTANETLREAQEQAGIATQKATESTQKAKEASDSAMAAAGSAATASEKEATATQKAKEASDSATAAAGSASISSEKAATATQKAGEAEASAAAAARSAEQAEQAAGCDGTAKSISATDTNGIGSTTVQGQLDALTAPVFDDTGAVADITGFQIFLDKLTSGMKIRDFFRNLKAGLKFVLHTGQLVNNGLCNEPGKYPLDAAYGRTLLEMIGNTADLPGGAADIVSAIVTQNSNLENCYSLSGGILIPDNADLYSDDYKVPGNYYCPGNANAATLKNCPLSKAFILKVDYTNGTQYIRQSFTQYDIEQNHQRIWNPIANKWEHESSLLTNADFLTKIVSLNQVTVPANAGIAGSTTNISGQIPSGYKLLDAREVGSGNNGCYIYYFRADGTNITLQLRNVTNAAITTSPSAQLLLIPK